MKRNVAWLLALALGFSVLAMPVARVRAEGDAPGTDKKEGDKKGRKGGGFNLMKVETIQEKLGTGEGMTLTDEQKTKINTLRDGLQKKWEEKMAAAKEKMDAAADDAAKKAARKEAMGDFKPMEEYKTGLKGILSDGQFIKVFPAKTEEAKSEAKKSE
ncbi:MAG: hypothetical protein HY291_07945 [Planctomycetes bacterium]|nr:hypothetical protein [Planctomycetota bacterium]